jgi:hypothetical protein
VFQFALNSLNRKKGSLDLFFSPVVIHVSVVPLATFLVIGVLLVLLLCICSQQHMREAERTQIEWDARCEACRYRSDGEERDSFTIGHLAARLAREYVTSRRYRRWSSHDVVMLYCHAFVARLYERPDPGKIQSRHALPSPLVRP